METSARPSADLVGSVLSGACAVHCVSTPAIVSLAPAAASVLGGFHPVLLVASALVAVWSFGSGVRRHRRWHVVLLAALGLTLLGSSAFLFEESPAETALSLAGAGLMVGAHARNRSLLRRA